MCRSAEWLVEFFDVPEHLTGRRLMQMFLSIFLSVAERSRVGFVVFWFRSWTVRLLICSKIICESRGTLMKWTAQGGGMGAFRSESLGEQPEWTFRGPPDDVNVPR